MILNLKGFYSIFIMKCNSHSHLKCIKNIKFVVSVLLCYCVSSQKCCRFSMILNLKGFYSIFIMKRNSHSHLNCIKNIKFVVSVLLCCALSILSYFMLNSTNSFHCDMSANPETVSVQNKTHLAILI